MQKLFSHILFWSGLLLGLTTLCLLGAEPSGTGEAALERYQESVDFWAPIMLWSWCGSLILVIVSGIVLHRLDQK